MTRCVHTEQRPIWVEGCAQAYVLWHRTSAGYLWTETDPPTAHEAPIVVRLQRVGTKHTTENDGRIVEHIRQVLFRFLPRST